MISNKSLPNILNPSEDFLQRKYRHKAAVTSSNKLLSYGECTIGGCRYINNNLGVSCHAEINAIKGLYKIKNIKGRCLF